MTDVGAIGVAPGPVLLLDGQRATCAQVRDVARGLASAAMTDEGIARAEAAARTAAQVTASREVYGRTTGVGANRDQPVDVADEAEYGYRLLRSHAGGSGPLIAADLSRAMLIVRANQIAAGGSGVDPGVLVPMLAGVNAGLWVPVPKYGAIGTGDLTALATAALCLLGERDWLLPANREPAPQPRFQLASADALAFLSQKYARHRQLLTRIGNAGDEDVGSIVGVLTQLSVEARLALAIARRRQSVLAVRPIGRPAGRLCCVEQLAQSATNAFLAGSHALPAV